MARPTMYSRWPPELPEEQLIDLHSHIKDWQITHGSLVKLVRSDQGHSVRSRPIGVSMFPTLFPRQWFTHALAIQKVYNKLYVNVAEDEAWLSETLKDMIASDPLTKILWSIHQDINREGYVQDLSLGIFRSDYMLHQEPMTTNGTSRPSTTLKQVEFNTFSVAGGSHANIVADMHRHMARTRVSIPDIAVSLSNLPPNHTINSLVSSLKLAHNAYKSSTTSLSSTGLDLAILFIVQPENINICDERPLEYGLCNDNPSIPVFRLEFPDYILHHTSLDQSRRLLFKPDPLLQPTRVFEISVVYFRAGYELEEYPDYGIAARLQLERSRAIKCPSILSHLTTFKKVQQALALPGALNHFLSDVESVLIAETFTPLHPLDMSEAGEHAREFATDPDEAVNYVLKPSLEGGGHNIYGGDIPAFLRGINQALWSHYILQELIKSPTMIHNILLSHRGIHRGNVVSELGAFGTVLWRRRATEPPDILHNAEAGWSFKTKASNVNEMSVIKGYGCFDCPYLVDDA